MKNTRIGKLPLAAEQIRILERGELEHLNGGATPPATVTTTVIITK